LIGENFGENKLAGKIGIFDEKDSRGYNNS